MQADMGDWIIKGIKGEFYPCKPDIFDLTYVACCLECYGTVDGHAHFCPRAWDGVEMDDDAE